MDMEIQCTSRAEAQKLFRKALQRKSWYELFNAIHSEKDWYPEGYDIDVSKPLEEILADLYKQINERKEEQKCD